MLRHRFTAVFRTESLISDAAIGGAGQVVLGRFEALPFLGIRTPWNGMTPFYHALLTGQPAQRAVRVTKVTGIGIGMNPKKKS
jgi:hypothetical protein